MTLGYGIARTDGCQVRWCRPVGAADGPVPGVFMLPPSAPSDEPELARALGTLGPVARFRTPSLWDALGTAIIRQVVRAGHAQRLYRTFCESYGLAVSCGGWTVRLFLSPGTVLELRNAQFADAGLARIEAALFGDAAATLTGMGVNVCHVDTGLLTPQQAASQIAGALAASCASLPARG